MSKSLLSHPLRLSNSNLEDIEESAGDNWQLKAKALIERREKKLRQRMV